MMVKDNDCYAVCVGICDDVMSCGAAIQHEKCLNIILKALIHVGFFWAVSFSNAMGNNE